MKDSDGDGWGDSNPSNSADVGTDCNDSDALLNQDDLDGDNQSTCAGDCDDSDEFTFIGSAEIDDVLACMRDFDGDGWGDLNPSNSADVGTDCDDSDSTLNQDDVGHHEIRSMFWRAIDGE